MRKSKLILVYYLAILSTLCGAAFAINSQHFSQRLSLNTMHEKNHTSQKYINWLEKQSLLYNAKSLAQKISGQGIQWQYPYAKPQPRKFIQTASVWFNAYPQSLITQPKQNVIQFLGDKTLWSTFEKIGIQALHTGPMKISGGIQGYEHTPSIDGFFDIINYSVDSHFGTASDYRNMAQVALKHHGIIIGDIIPGHTGKGADFLLAERNYKDYPGIYDIVEIKKEDWPLLPEVSNQWDSASIDSTVVEKLITKEYLPGHLQRVSYTSPQSSEKNSGWDATGVIEGVDGIKRRWVYLHYFKPGQPTLNWLDPSCSANRILASAIINSIHELGNKALRIDANSFLGIEPIGSSNVTWSENHPLSINVSNQLAWLTRSLGAWTFQELDSTLEALKTFIQYGPDLSYDFISRPALEHAILTKDATFLRFMLHLMQDYQIDPGTLIHDMQNHDEITYELVHLEKHQNYSFIYDNQKMTGKAIREKIINEMHALAIGPKTPYNKLSGNGLCTTLTGLMAARLGITNLDQITPKQKQTIQKGHLLMATFNAMQPGIFGLSGWDLVGALPLPTDQIKNLVADGDYRWVNRGAYDLMGYNQTSDHSSSGLPKAKNLYGPIPLQLKDQNSFVSQLQHMLKVRDEYHIALSELIDIPAVKHKSVLIMAFKLPKEKGYALTILNFGDQAVTEPINLHKIKHLTVDDLEGFRIIDLLDYKIHSLVKISGKLNVHLEPLSAEVLVIKLK